MKTVIHYATNSQLWEMEHIAAAHGFRKIGECYWVQMFANGTREITTARETSVSGDPVAAFAAAVEVH